MVSCSFMVPCAFILLCLSKGMAYLWHGHESSQPRFTHSNLLCSHGSDDRLGEITERENFLKT